MTQINIKRVYEDWEESDGYRILVDRLWPRGVSKEKAQLDVWIKEIAPTDELRKWFGHEAPKWDEFKRKYITEIKENNKGQVQLIDAVTGQKKVTLLFGAKDQEHNQAVVLQEWLENEIR